MSLLVLPVGFERIAAQHRTHGDYVETCEAEFALVKPWLKPGDVLDIGCGLGGMSVLCARYCGGRVYLLDGTGWAARRTGYRGLAQPFNDNRGTVEMMRLNGIREFEILPIGCRDLPAVDNVVSFWALGWHFGVESYPVHKALTQGGRLILDIRKATHGEQSLSSSFDRVGTIDISPKGARSAWDRL